MNEYISACDLNGGEISGGFIQGQGITINGYDNEDNSLTTISTDSIKNKMCNWWKNKIGTPIADKEEPKEQEEPDSFTSQEWEEFAKELNLEDQSRSVYSDYTHQYYTTSLSG